MRILLLILFLLQLIIPANGFSKNLKTELDTYLNKLPVKRNVSIYLELLKSNQKFLKDPDKVVPAASIIKLPVMAEVMEQVKEKKLKLSDSLTLKSTDKVGGGGLLKNYKNNTKVTIEQLVFLMITESDNTATNMLINKVGMNSVNQRIKKLGMKNTSLELLIFDLKAYSQGKDNKTTAADMGILLKKIYNNQLATPELCKYMIEILKKNKNNNAIPKYIKGIPIAHKTGSLAGIKGDVAIILSKNPYILSIFVKGLPEPQAEKIIADIARISFEGLRS
jgi:beta-lactamase class A